MRQRSGSASAALSVYPGTGSLGAAMKEALQTTLILVVWIVVLFCLDLFLAGVFVGGCCAACSAHRHGIFVRYRPAVDHHDRFQLHRLLRWCIRCSQTGGFDTEEKMIRGAVGWGDGGVCSPAITRTTIAN